MLLCAWLDASLPLLVTWPVLRNQPQPSCSVDAARSIKRTSTKQPSQPHSRNASKSRILPTSDLELAY